MTARLKVCAWCNALLNRELVWQQIFSFRPLYFDCMCTDCRALFSPYQPSELSCQTCGRKVELCDKAWDAVFSDEKNFSYGFEVTLTSERITSKKILCFDCVRWLEDFPIELIKHDAVLEYNEAFREWLYRYKYRGDYRLREIVAEPLQNVYQQYNDYQWLVLPSSLNSLRERRFHATAGLLEAADIPFLNPFLYVGDGRKQSQKSRIERLKLRQPFDIRDETLVKLSQKILIFDDVYTTGATLLFAKKLLTEKAKEISSTTDTLIIASLSLARDSQFTTE